MRNSEEISLWLFYVFYKENVTFCILDEYFSSPVDLLLLEDENWRTFYGFFLDFLADERWNYLKTKVCSQIVVDERWNYLGKYDRKKGQKKRRREFAT